MDPAWIALIATIMGGAGLKVVEKFLSRSQTKIDIASALREELRMESMASKAEAARLREEVRQVEKELDQWKEKYFLLLREYMDIKAEKGKEVEW